jgi:hypothetical protein
MTEALPLPEPEESADGVDLTLIRWFLSLTPLERLETLQDWVDGLSELQETLTP